MKKTILILAATALLASCGDKGQAPQLESQSDTISWVVGQSMAESIKATGIKVDNAMVLKAVEATLNNGKQPLDAETYQQMLAFLTDMATMNQRQQMESTISQAKEAQDAYFAQLAQEKSSLKKTPSGYYYEVVKDGSGSRCKEGDVVVFDYRSFTALDNKLFDQTYGNREAITHVVGAPMMPALIEAFTLMNAGATYRFYFPMEAVAEGQGIENASPMVYEIELKKVNPTDNYADVQ